MHIVFDRQQILGTVLPMHLAGVRGVRLRSNFFLSLLTRRLTDRSAAIELFIRTHCHVGVDRVLIFCSKQARVVLGEVTLLPLTHLAAHDEARAQLHGLRVEETRAWRY